MRETVELRDSSSDTSDLDVDCFRGAESPISSVPREALRRDVAREKSKTRGSDNDSDNDSGFLDDCRVRSKRPKEESLASPLKAEEIACPRDRYLDEISRLEIFSRFKFPVDRSGDGTTQWDAAKAELTALLERKFGETNTSRSKTRRNEVGTKEEGESTDTNDWSDEERHDWLMERLREYFSVLPDSLLKMASVMARCGDCGADTSARPAWLDVEKFRRGQRFVRDNMAGVFMSQLLSLYTLFSFRDGLRPLVITGKSGTPYTAFKRYLSTAIYVRNWYTEDPWTKGTSAYNSIEVVRKMHENVRKKLNGLSFNDMETASKIDSAWCPKRNILLEDFQSVCPVAAPGQCPYNTTLFDSSVKQNRLTLGEMACTQFGFFGLALLYPRAFGIHNATDEDLDAYIHVWRGLGYRLGIDDDYNFCSGTLAEVKERSRDFVELWVKPNFRDITPEWEHMMRCVLEGQRYYFSTMSYEMTLLYLTEVFDIQMPRLRASITYLEWIVFNFVKFIMRYAMRLPWLVKYMNWKLNRRIDVAMNFSEEKHDELRQRSLKIM